MTRDPRSPDPRKALESRDPSPLVPSSTREFFPLNILRFPIPIGLKYDVYRMFPKNRTVPLNLLIVEEKERSFLK